MIDTEKAMRCVVEYCEAHGLSVEKLTKNTAASFCEDLHVLGFPKLAPEDRYDEVKGRGFPVFIVDPDYTVRETERTREYFDSVE